MRLFPTFEPAFLKVRFRAITMVMKSCVIISFLGNFANHEKMDKRALNQQIEIDFDHAKIEERQQFMKS